MCDLPAPPTIVELSEPLDLPFKTYQPGGSKAPHLPPFVFGGETSHMSYEKGFSVDGIPIANTTHGFDRRRVLSQFLAQRGHVDVNGPIGHIQVT